MGKVSKKLLFVLIITALVIPLFVGCEPEPTVDNKADFIDLLKSEVGKTGVATLTNSGDNLTVTFVDGKSVSDIKAKAKSLYATFQNKTAAGTKLKIANNAYFNLDSFTDASLTEIATQVRTEIGTGKSTTYSATIVFNGETFTMTGTITFEGIPT